MEGVGCDRSIFYKRGAFFEEFLGDGEFAVVFFSAVAGHCNGPSVFVFAEGDDGSEVVAEVFAVEGKAFGKLVLMGGEPLVEGGGEGRRIDAVDEVVEGVVAGHDEVPAFAADVEADGFALALAEGGAAFPDRFDVGRSDEQAVGDEAEHRDFSVASRERAAVIGDLVEGVREAAEVFVGEGAAGSGDSFRGAFLIDHGQRIGAGEELLGIFMKRVDPVFLDLRQLCMTDFLSVRQDRVTEW